MIVIKKRELKQKSFNVYEDDYKVFKEIAKELDSDASKEIRKFMKKYIKEHQDIVNRLF